MMRASLSIDTQRIIDVIDERIYSSFIEHMGRAVYGGIYEPQHKTADAYGFRQDVMELIRPLNIPLIRYPGGNFVSGYDWEDGVGRNRYKRLDPAWQQLEPNEVGTDEFHGWAKRVNTGVMMAVNLGTRGPSEAANLLEYCNFPAGTKYADMRVENGNAEPYNDKVWCLGNEMDGIWQVGHRTVQDYADTARKTACLMKMLDPSLELVACGSANYQMPTFGAWERAVLEQAYDQISFLSLHQYYQNPGNNTPEFLGCAKEMDGFINTVTAICDAVGGARRTDKKVHLSFDEWNVWPKHSCDNSADQWMIGPRRGEFEFTMEDALVFGTLLNTLIHHCDRVKMACLAQLVNVCAPIMTENGGVAWANTIYYPFLHASTYGRGTALMETLECPTYTAGRHGETQLVSTSVVLSENKDEITVFAVNRSLNEGVEMSLSGFDGYTMKEHIVMTAKDLEDTNTADHPDLVMPHNATIAQSGSVTLEKASWNVVRLSK